MTAKKTGPTFASPEEADGLLSVIKREFTRLTATLPVERHIWREAGGMDTWLAARVERSAKRRLSFVCVAKELLDAELRHGAGIAAVRPLLGMVPQLTEGLREVVKNAGKRARFVPKAERPVYRPVEWVEELARQLRERGHVCLLGPKRVPNSERGWYTDEHMDYLEDCLDDDRALAAHYRRQVARWRGEKLSGGATLRVRRFERVLYKFVADLRVQATRLADARAYTVEGKSLLEIRDYLEAMAGGDGWDEDMAARDLMEN